MQKSQVNRRTVARRVAKSAAPRRVQGTVGTNPSLRVMTEIAEGGNFGVRRSRIGSHGQAGPWSQPAHLPLSHPAMQSVWSKTVSDFRR